MQPAGGKIQFFLCFYRMQRKSCQCSCVRAKSDYIGTQMVQGLQLSQRLSQSLVLSPQMQHSLALLQAPTLELKALVEHEMEQNPVLEEVAAPETELADKAKAERTTTRPPSRRLKRLRASRRSRTRPWTIFRRSLNSWCNWTRNGATILRRPTSPSANPRGGGKAPVHVRFAHGGNVPGGSLDGAGPRNEFDGRTARDRRKHRRQH